MLTQKFGSLPADHREEIEAADSDAIHRWVGLALSAETIEQVFNGAGEPAKEREISRENSRKEGFA